MWYERVDDVWTRDATGSGGCRRDEGDKRFKSLRNGGRAAENSEQVAGLKLRENWEFMKIADLL